MKAIVETFEWSDLDQKNVKLSYSCDYSNGNDYSIEILGAHYNGKLYVLASKKMFKEQDNYRE